MRGLDPRIHDEVKRTKILRRALSLRIMDCRVKPGNDSYVMGSQQPARALG